MILPRQARDKHRKTPKKERFLTRFRLHSIRLGQHLRYNTNVLRTHQILFVSTVHSAGEKTVVYQDRLGTTTNIGEALELEWWICRQLSARDRLVRQGGRLLLPDPGATKRLF
eukprot:COSAG06_NODE_5458_length_3468_cov_1.829326_2_plen_113_part_00